MTMLSWNIRGLNSPSKIEVVKSLVSKFKVDMLILIEKTMVRKLGSKWIWQQNYFHSRKGRL